VWYGLAVARKRFEQLPRERQEEILGLAAAEFARSGFQGTSYNQLLERLNLGKSSAYYYFDDKRDLFLTVVARCYATYFEAMARLERPTIRDEFWPYVHRSTVHGYGLMLADPTAAHLLQCFVRERNLLGELTSAEVLATMDDVYEDAIRLGQSLGAIRTDLPQRLLLETVRNLGVTFDQWFIRERERGADAPTPEAAATAYTDMVRRICTVP